MQQGFPERVSFESKTFLTNLQENKSTLITKVPLLTIRLKKGQKPRLDLRNVIDFLVNEYD